MNKGHGGESNPYGQSGDGRQHRTSKDAQQQEEEQMLSWLSRQMTSWKSRALHAESKWAEVDAEKRSLQQALAQANREIEATRSDRSRVKAERDQLDQRLTMQMGEACLSDRTNLSIAGTVSQPNQIADEFREFQKRFEKVVRKTRKSAPGENAKYEVARGVALLARLVFDRAAQLLCAIGGLDEVTAARDVRSLFCEKMPADSAAAATEAIETVASEGFQLLRRVVISTAPQKPGVIVFVSAGVQFNSHIHQVWADSPNTEDASVLFTVYPGYFVGDEPFVRAVVTTKAAPVSPTTPAAPPPPPTPSEGIDRLA